MSTKRRKCLNDPDHFCYICGQYKLVEQLRPITDSVKKVYLAYFKIKLGDQDKDWAPHTVCVKCMKELSSWPRKERLHPPFAIPCVWREPKNHHDDCLFCSVDVIARNKSGLKNTIQRLGFLYPTCFAHS